MKTFLRENKLRLILLGVPVLCLIVLWNINIYRIWYVITPWQNLGSPPNVRAVRIGNIYFPDKHYSSSRSLPYDYDIYNSYYSPSAKPVVFVYGEDEREYPLDWRDQWWPGTFPKDLDYENRQINEENGCAQEIRLRWEIKEEKDENSKIIDSRGSCAEYSFDGDYYVVFKIDQNGIIWEKYVNGENPGNFRKWATFYISLFLVISAPIWMRLFIEFDFLKPKPDYDAN